MNRKKSKMRLVCRSFKISVLLFLLSLTILGCQKKWSDEKREAFRQQCSETKTFENLVIRFIGFDNSEFDSVTVEEYRGSVLEDTFSVPVGPCRNFSDPSRKERNATIERTMNIDCSYRFILPEEEPYILDNMEMIMWAQFTMTSEGWGCVMGNYTIDGKLFEHNANPTFVKRELWNGE